MPTPTADNSELIIDVEAVGIGYFDSVLLRGLYQEKPALPMIPGRECCGTVIAVGSGVDPELIGRRIAAIAFSGSMAEKAVVKSSHMLLLPNGMHVATGAAFLSAYATVLYALTDCGRQKSGETILVLGAAGTVGQAAIDIGKALGSRIVAAASSVEKRNVCLARGADHAIDYTADNWRKELRRLAPNGVDVIVDPVGGALSEIAFRHLAPRGRHLIIGFTTGQIARLPLNLPLLKRASLIGVDWGGFAQQEPEANRALLDRLGNMLASGELSPAANNTYSVGQFAQVIENLVARRSIGKPVILLNDL